MYTLFDLIQSVCTTRQRCYLRYDSSVHLYTYYICNDDFLPVIVLSSFVNRHEQ